LVGCFRHRLLASTRCFTMRSTRKSIVPRISVLLRTSVLSPRLLPPCRRRRLARSEREERRGQGGEEAPAQGERTWSKGKGKGREEEDWSRRTVFCSSGRRRRPVTVLGISGCVLMAWGHDRNSPWRHLRDGFQNPHFRGLLPLCPITCVHRLQRSNLWAARATAKWVARDLGRESGRGIRTRVVHERWVG
jgi:hypothetical protein